jgi:YVTN family beta-propeller protein/cysteine-rich repeat protein
MKHRVAASITAALVFAAAGHAAANPFAYIANNDSEDVSILDTSTNTVVDTISLTPGRARGAVLSPDGGKLYVTLQVTDTVAVVDTLTNTVITSIPIGPFPVGFPDDLALNPAGTRLYVTAGCCNVVVIDTTTNTVAETIPTLAPGSPDLAGIAVNDAGTRVYVTEKFSETMFVIDATTDTVLTTVANAGNSGVIVDSVANLVYATRAGAGTVEVTDALTNTVVDTIPIGCTAGRLVQNAARTHLYVTCSTGFPGDPLKVVDLGTSSVVATVPLGRGPQGVDITPDDALVYAANLLDDNVSVIDTATNTVVDTVAVGTLPIGRGRFISHEFVCGNGNHEPGEACDDGGTLPGDGCDAVCEIEPCFAAAPCATAAASSITVKDSDTPSKDQVSWKWKKGTIDAADLGDPTSSTPYELCVLDDGIPALVFTVPAGLTCDGGKDCWKMLGKLPSPKGYKYANKATSSEGVSGLIVKAGAGKASIGFKAKSVQLTLPGPVLPGQYFTQTANVTVRLRRLDASECWESVYPTSTKNTAEQFGAKTP